MAVNGEEIVCLLVAVSGHLFSLEFDRAPRRWLSRPEIKIISVDTWARPIKPQQRELRALLPADYAEIAAATIPQSSPAYEAAILSLDEIYDASFDDGRYWLLAEIPDVGMLGVKDQGIAVGTRITARPPHRTGRARLRHPAPTLGV